MEEGTRPKRTDKERGAVKTDLILKGAGTQKLMGKRAGPNCVDGERGGAKTKFIEAGSGSKQNRERGVSKKELTLKELEPKWN